METEIEAKFLNVALNEFRSVLRQAGARLVQAERMMKRAVYDFPDGRLGKSHGWVRLRDEGDKVTLSYKQQKERTLTGTKETCIIVNSFAEATELLRSIGLEQKSYQENYRESWLLDEAEVELDTWPWVPSYVEIEAKSKHDLEAVAAKLGLDLGNAKHGSVEVVYSTHYDVTEQDILGLEEITFESQPRLFASPRRTT